VTYDGYRRYGRWNDPPPRAARRVTVAYDPAGPHDLVVAVRLPSWTSTYYHHRPDRPTERTDRPMTATATSTEDDELTAEAEAAAAAAELRLDERNTDPEDVTDAACAHTTRFPREALRSLGSCGPYLRAHAELFPTARFPKGPALTAEVCARYHDRFDWDWACGNMLTWEGREEADRVYRSRAQRYQELGTGTARRAAAFGHVYERYPHYRNARVVEACVTAARRLDDRLLADVDDERARIADLERSIAGQTAELERRRAGLPRVEARAAGARRRQARRDLAARAARLEELEREARVLAARVDAERAALTEAEAALAASDATTATATATATDTTEEAS
jgi:hypothetical protein